MGLGLWTLLAAGCRPAPAPQASPTAFPGITATLSTNAVRVGDLVRLAVTVDHPEGTRAQMPDFARGKELVVRHFQEEASSPVAGRVRSTFAYDVASLVVGTHVLSSNAVQILHADGTATSLPFPALALEVRTTLADAGVKPRDIKGLAQWPAAFPHWVTVLLLVALLASAAALALARVLRKPRTILHHPPPPPPHEVALAALRDLLSRGWIEAGNAEPFYVELSGIVRRYIEDRFSLRAPERTTEEFIREAASSRLLTPDHQLLTRDFLEQCDLVKFARHRPASDEMRAGYAAAERLVRETMPPEPSTLDPQPSPPPHSP